MSDMWTGPTPIAQQFPKHEPDGIAQLVALVRQQGTQIREVTSNLLRSMGVRARPGQMSSLDYDGTGHASLGTAGWALASDNGGPSYLALNGVDVYADLAAKDAAFAAQDAIILAQQAYLASLVTKDATAAGFNTGTLTADSTVRYVGTPGTLSIDCPTGKLRVIVSCPEASISCGTGSGGVIAYLSFSISGQVAMGDYTSRLYSAGTRLGATLTRLKTLTVPPGTYTVSVQAGYWCSGFTAASIDFSDMDLSAEVVNAA